MLRHSSMPGRTPSVARAAVVAVFVAGCVSRAPVQAPSQSAHANPPPASSASGPESPVDSSALDILNAAVGARVGDAPAQDDPADGPAAQPESARGWLGVELGRAPANQTGALVRSVVRGSPADRAGIKDGDLLTTVDGRSVQGPGDVIRIVASHSPGDSLPVAFTHGAQPRLLRVQLAPFPDQDEMLKMQFAGQRAPELLKLSPIQGSVAPSIGSLKGKVLLLEFWASWCVPCRILAPKIEDMYQRYAPQGVAVLGVTTDPVSDASRAAAEIGMKYPLASDESGDTTRAYRALALPTLFVIDRQGVVRDVMVGYSSERVEQIRAQVEQLLRP